MGFSRNQWIFGETNGFLKKKIHGILQKAMDFWKACWFLKKTMGFWRNMGAQRTYGFLQSSIGLSHWFLKNPWIFGENQWVFGKNLQVVQKSIFFCRILWIFPPKTHGFLQKKLVTKKKQSENSHQITILFEHWPRPKPKIYGPIPKTVSRRNLPYCLGSGFSSASWRNTIARLEVLALYYFWIDSRT